MNNNASFLLPNCWFFPRYIQVWNLIDCASMCSFVSVIHLFVGVVYCLVSWSVGLPKRAVSQVQYLPAHNPKIKLNRSCIGQLEKNYGDNRL